MISHFFGTLQKIGKALMLPVSVLPVAGLLLGIGSSGLSWLPSEVSMVMAQAGGAIFGNLPLIFALGVVIGLTDNDGVACIAATVGFVVLLGTMGVIAEINGVPTKEIMGIKSIETGVFGGIISGFVAAVMFKRFYRIKLPDYLGFFSGKRFVPIVTAFAMIAVALILSVIWPPIQGVIKYTSHYAVNENPNAMVFLYGLVERMLIPFGLHHIWNVPFFFEAGEFTNAVGKVFNGDVNRFFAGDPTAGFLGGGYLFKMFGLPAAAIAMWHTAKLENKKLVGSLMISAAFTSFLTGITEPIEFAFLFVAPLLYGLHALMAGTCFLVMNMMGAKLGFTFSHGLIDYVLYYHMDTKPWLVLILGPITALIYYTVFRVVIQKLNILTPGREDKSTEESEVLNATDRAAKIIEGFGGVANIQTLDACITRLRVKVSDISKVNKEKLVDLGATGVIFIGENVQAIFGTQSDIIKSEMEQVIKTPNTQPTSSFISPIAGEVKELCDVPDKVFSEGLMGKGFAINPKSGRIIAPFDGEVVTLFKTNHAIGLKDGEGREVLIHFGIDTVKLKGEGFTSKVQKGDRFKSGDLLLEVDLNFVRENSPSIMTPIIFTNRVEDLKINTLGSVVEGQSNIIDF
ncbi:PTS glucose transporter subunit IIBC [Halobacteriovorax sp. JY17]|uniref:PTS glucose transporter subunit IIBC n=1 Tax=Halobacteriovorax sp. JY17 TaxID=2014617 RepID=UPI000C5C3CC4|nr:PTS glucose transporter subunit IIBC [Halobacteriovorax sp. JY17]PIK15712.1 MAG: PTS glucose transporter subunit IIBC [Halobacteriovorax sp. JY17]